MLAAPSQSKTLSTSLGGYLRAIYDLVRDQSHMHVLDIANARGVRTASVVPAVRRLDETRRTRRSLPTAAALAAALAGGCTTAGAQRPPYAITRLSPHAELPVEPRWCGAAPTGRWRWLLVSSRHCDSCERQARDLDAVRDELTATDVAVGVIFIDGKSCPATVREAGQVSRFPVGLASDRLQAQWNTYTTPMTYLTGANRVYAVVVGRAPVSVLLREQQRLQEVERPVAATGNEPAPVGPRRNP